MDALSTPDAELQINLLKNNDSNFRVMALWLASDPLYGKVPLDRLQLLNRWLVAGRVIVATVENHRIVGALAWSMLDTEAARQSIRQGSLPAPDAVESTGNEILMTLIAGSQPGVVKRLMRRFIALQRGKVLLYERHLSRGTNTERFGWVDRCGVLQGPDL